MKKDFLYFEGVRSFTELNLIWADPGALIVKQYFESGSGSHQTVFGRMERCKKGGEILSTILKILGCSNLEFEYLKIF